MAHVLQEDGVMSLSLNELLWESDPNGARVDIDPISLSVVLRGVQIGKLDSVSSTLLDKDGLDTNYSINRGSYGDRINFSYEPKSIIPDPVDWQRNCLESARSSSYSLPDYTVRLPGY